ncbi:MAG TPA: iron-containing alcohol dehydrogenase [Planctomycetota bacterium]|nr:iron-containing alcohol dehydrogenase [Planctomycetota bacterium]
MNFTLGMPRRIYFGAGLIHKIDDHALPLGRRFLLVLSRTIARDTKIDEALRAQLTGHQAACATVTSSGEPTVQDVDDAVIVARSFQADCVIGIGGGSALDLAKAVAAIAPQPVQGLQKPALPAGPGNALRDLSVQDYLEGVGIGAPLVNPPLPTVLAPTTAGTGSEATRNSVIASPEKAFKKSLRSDRMFADVALIDPELCRSCPRSVVAQSGLDALTQLIEPYISRGANPLTDALIAATLPKAARALPIAWRDPIGADPHIWDALCTGSLAGGVALTNAGLGAVHGFAAALGAKYPIAHGLICAALLAPTLEANRNALAAIDANHAGLERIGQVGRWLAGRDDLTRDQGITHAIDAIRALVAEFQIPNLADLGVKREDYPFLVAEARTGSSMKFNPVPLNDQQLEWILEKARG